MKKETTKEKTNKQSFGKLAKALNELSENDKVYCVIDKENRKTGGITFYRTAISFSGFEILGMLQKTLFEVNAMIAVKHGVKALSVYKGRKVREYDIYQEEEE